MRMLKRVVFDRDIQMPENGRVMEDSLVDPVFGGRYEISIDDSVGEIVVTGKSGVEIRIPKVRAVFFEVIPEG